MLSDTEYEAKLTEFENLAGVVRTPVAPRLYVGAARWKPDKMPDPNNRDQYGRSIDILNIEKDFRKGIIVPDYSVEKVGRSLLRNIYNIQTCNFVSVSPASASPNWGDGFINVKEISGTVRSGVPTIIVSWTGQEQTTYGNYTQNGIHIGTDNTAVGFDQYACVNDIVHGDGAGEMRYWDMFVVAKSYDAGTRVWSKELVRYFTNHSGGGITVAEMVLCFVVVNGSSTWYVAVARDLLSPAIVVANHELIRCKYTLTFAAFPA